MFVDVVLSPKLPRRREPHRSIRDHDHYRNKADGLAHARDAVAALPTTRFPADVGADATTLYDTLTYTRHTSRRRRGTRTPGPPPLPRRVAHAALVDDERRGTDRPH